MYYQILALLLAVPCSSYVNCRTACLECRKGNNAEEVADIYCSMCQECRERRLERIDRLRKHMLRQNEKVDVPAGCPTPPPCSGPSTVQTRTPKSSSVPYYPEGCPTPPPCKETPSTCPPGCMPSCPPVTGCMRRNARSNTIQMLPQTQQSELQGRKNLDSFFVGVPDNALTL